MNDARPQLRKPPWQRPGARTVVFIAVLVLAVAALVARLVELQIVDGETYRAAAQANQIRLIPVAAPRGTIYGRGGSVLARSRASFVVALIPSEMTAVDAELTTLAGILQVPKEMLLHRMLHHRGLNYRSVAEVTAYEPYGPIQLASDLPITKVARLSEFLSDLPGVDLETQPIREYPEGPYASHLLGYVGLITQDEYATLKHEGYSPNDVIGKDGLEFQYDKQLRGVPGGQRVIVDATGAVVPGTKLPARAAVAGDSLSTTVDVRLQRIVESALADGIKAWGHGRPLSGAAVAEDPYTGDVLAMASFPNFNPNDFAADHYAAIGRYLTSAADPLYNRAIAAATPTGSTFKMVTGSAALTERVVTPTQMVYDSGSFDCGGYVAHDIASGGLGSTSFVRALAASSDGYFFRLSWYLGLDRLRRYALAYGLASRSGIDLPGEIAGNWPTNAWMMKNFGLPEEPSDVCSLGIGQGAMQATPLQMVNVASAVVNGGTLFRPRIVRAIRAPSGALVAAFPEEVIRRVPVSPVALSYVRAGMAKVTDPGGTAYGLAIDGLPFSGKTGTVETAGGQGPNTTWFICWAPSVHPKFAMAVYVDRSGGYGAQVAAPIARDVLVRYFNPKA